MNSNILGQQQSNPESNVLNDQHQIREESNIQIPLIQMDTISHSELIQRIGSLENFYNILQQKGFYLPKKDSPYVTIDYLMKVASEGVLCFLRKNITLAYTVKKISKLDIFKELDEWAHKKKYNLGFDMFHLPDKEFLLNVLLLVWPEHPYFNFKKDEMKTFDVHHKIPKGEFLIFAKVNIFLGFLRMCITISWYKARESCD